MDITHSRNALVISATGDPERQVDAAVLPRRRLAVLSAAREERFQTVVRDSLLRQISRLGDQTAPEEICGVLVGNLYSDGQPYLLVENLIPLQTGGLIDRSTFSPQAWREVEEALRRQYPEQQVVGWYYTHPGRGLTLSAFDRHRHDKQFKSPWQCVLAYDPAGGEHRVYGGACGAWLQAMPFLVEYEDGAAAVVNPPRRQVQLPGRWPGQIPGIVGKLLVGTVGLAMFAAMGYLAGLAIKQLHWKLPMGF